MTPLRHIVVVGNGVAGLTAADTLRSAGFDGELTIVGEENVAAYSRPALSKALLRSDADLTAHELPAPDHGATELLGRAAASIDVARRVLTLDDGADLGYDGLVIASGSRARRLGGAATAGAASAGAASATTELVLRTLDDALALRARIASRPDVVVIGGGPLGMEVASGAVEAGCMVTLVTREQPMLRHLGAHLSATIAAAAVARGLRIVLTPDARIAERDGRPAVVTAEGDVIGGDLLLTAAGDLPNTEWLAGSGMHGVRLQDGGAVAVDARGRVNDRIVAAGDVAAVPTASGHARSPLWNSAIDQARVAAVALLRGDDAPELNARPYFWTEQFDLTLRVAGPTPLLGAPEFVDGDDSAGPALLRWRHSDGTATAVSVNYRIPIPRLRRLCEPE